MLRSASRSGRTGGRTDLSMTWLIRLAGPIGFCGYRDLRFQLEEVLFADPADVHKVFDFLERPVVLAILDDSGCRLGANARKHFEVGRRRRVDVDRAGERGFRAGTTAGLRRPGT